MKYMILCLLSFSLLFAGTSEDLEILSTENSGGIDYVAPPEPLDPATLSDINDPSSAFEYVSPIERATIWGYEGSSVWPDYDWDNDIIVYPGRVGTGQDFDIDEITGDIYAIFDTNHFTGDSLVVYRSQDGGATWSFFIYGSNVDGSISFPKIRVVKDGSGNSWVVMMGVWIESGDNVLWTRRVRTNGTSAVWEQAASDVYYADMDADVGNGAYAYITYVVDETIQSIRAVRNAIGGAGWVDDANIYGNPRVTNPRPAVAAGAGGNVSIALIYDPTSDVPEIRIKRSTDNASSWLASEEVMGSGSWDDLENVDIAYNHSGTQVGWITVTFEFGSNDNFGYYHSANSGVSWAYGSLFSTGKDERLGSIRARKTTGALTVAYNVDPGDSVMFCWAAAGDPTNFTIPLRINDFNATGNWGPCAGWNGSGYSAILYTNFTSNYRLMYDWYSNVGIDDSPEGSVEPGMIRNTPNPFSASTNISFNLAQSSPVTISIYNIAGQLVRTLADNQSFNGGSNSVLWDGNSFSGTAVSPGVYFCRLNADGISQTHRMMMVR
ncbi:MAG: T9SS type A sorting domain-containing protein [Candidatus Aegiribacteria sp.]|nr:T9SS type A sorting domain-containing protein [Candidatus Aegiribacteria sp.]